MKKLFKNSMVLLLLFVVSCQKDGQIIEDVEQIKIDTTEIAAKKTSEYITVENLFKEFKDNAALTVTYNDFVDYQYGQISSNPNYTIPISDINQLISDLGPSFSSKLQAVSNLNLTHAEFNTIAADIDKDYNNQSRSCWICNPKACIFSTAMANTPLPGYIIGWVGVWVHCD